MTDRVNSAVKTILKDPGFSQKALAYTVMGVLISALYRERADIDLALQTISYLTERIEEMSAEELGAAKTVTEVLAVLVPEAFLSPIVSMAPAEQC
jgi:hypothetical protein